MKQNKALVVTIIFISFLMLISCSQKFPLPTSKEVGLLVIAVKATNETKHNFAYKYALDHLPETSVEIRILPSTTGKYVMIGDFPVGKYWISGIKSMPVHSGTSIPLSFGKGRAINGDSFEIRPNQVTLLNSRFVVLKKKLTDSRSKQYWKFEKLDEITKSGLIRRLKELENSERWTFPE